MNYKNRKLKKKSILTVMAVVGLLVTAGVIGLFVWQNKTAADAAKMNNENMGKSVFVFDDAKVTGWWTSGNSWPSIKDFTGDQIKESDLPVADISIHQCKTMNQCKDPKKDITGGHCFVMLSYKRDLVEPAAAVTERLRQNTSFGDMTIQEVGVRTLAMSTSEGAVDYQLHQYDYTPKGGNKIMRGNALGYVVLPDGYIEVQGVCAEANQLNETMPVLEAVRLTM